MGRYIYKAKFRKITRYELDDAFSELFELFSVSLGRYDEISMESKSGFSRASRSGLRMEQSMPYRLGELKKVLKSSPVRLVRKRGVLTHSGSFDEMAARPRLSRG